MIREEAIKHIKDIICENNTVKHSNIVVFEEEKEALRMAIKALSQEPCKDTISREDVIKLVECSGYDLQFRTDNADMCDDVRKLPPVTPSRRKGHWIAHSDGGIWIKYYECSECHKHKGEKTDFCPNCGAEMVEPKESEGMNDLR